MKITYTLTRPDKGVSHDIQVSDAQKVKDTMQVLAENLSVFADLPKVPCIVEAESGRKISVEDTYEEARIYSGAELYIIK